MRKSLAEHVADTNRMIAEHKAKLAEEHGLVGHPKLDKLYQLAWDQGHPSGLAEVGYYFDDFAELLKP